MGMSDQSVKNNLQAQHTAQVQHITANLPDLQSPQGSLNASA
jgi:hypothetical protein